MSLTYQQQWRDASICMNDSQLCPDFQIQRARFNQLNLAQFYQIARLRQNVFIIEQQSIYADLDNCDQQAIHFCCWGTDALQEHLVGYARYRYLDSKNVCVIERVVMTQAARGKGIASQLMHMMVTEIRSQYSSAKVSLSAQVEAQAFYQRFGFVAVGDSYDDGGIEHISMYLAD